jgi:formate/nitrite transporter FocA (FNT family)
MGDQDGEYSEPQLDEAFERLAEEGENRLDRPLLPLLTTGILGGIDVATGLLAYLLVEDETHNPLVAGWAFSIGLIALLLARSELFTENFLIPVVSLVAGRARPWALLRLWLVALATNLLGGWMMTALLVVGLPRLKATAIDVGTSYAQLGVTGRSFALAVLAGAFLTLMTRMQHASDQLGVQIVAAVLVGWLVAGGQLFHCVIDSLFMFAALWAGAPFGYLDWLTALCWSAFGNLVGGLLLVTFIRLLQIPHRIAQARTTSRQTE